MSAYSTAMWPYESVHASIHAYQLLVVSELGSCEQAVDQRAVHAATCRPARRPRPLPSPPVK